MLPFFIFYAIVGVMTGIPYRHYPYGLRLVWGFLFPLHWPFALYGVKETVDGMGALIGLLVSAAGFGWVAWCAANLAAEFWKKEGLEGTIVAIVALLVMAGLCTKRT